MDQVHPIVSETFDFSEVMKNVVIFVELHNDKEDRSAEVTNFIAAQGVRVSGTLNKDCTHVVFKDGELHTYKMAKELGIPVVSMLWFEACKSHNRILDPEGFPISNAERYENPELFSKTHIRFDNKCEH